MLLWDGSHLLHRCLHQPELYEMVNSNGIRTGLIHGFLQSMQGLSNRFKGHGHCVCWDLGCSTFRSNLYKDYKLRSGSRNDPDFKPEIDINSLDTEDQVYYFSRSTLHNKLLPLTGTISVQAHGIEADDIISWISRHAYKDRIIIVSSDRDLLQLLRPGVEFYNPIQHVNMTHKDVIKKYGLNKKHWVEQFVLMKALMGDASDNIMGISGVGEKTAVKIAEILIFGDGWKAVGNSHLKAWQEAYRQKELVKSNIPLVDLARLPIEEVQRIKNQIAISIIGSPGQEEEDSLNKYLFKFELNKARTFVRSIIDANTFSPIRAEIKAALKVGDTQDGKIATSKNSGSKKSKTKKGKARKPK